MTLKDGFDQEEVAELISMDVNEPNEAAKSRFGMMRQEAIADGIGESLRTMSKTEEKIPNP